MSAAARRRGRPDHNNADPWTVWLQEITRCGYETLQTNWEVEPPWYQVIPFDFFTEVLWLGHLHDTHNRHFVLEPRVLPTADELIRRALQTRARALDPRK